MNHHSDERDRYDFQLREHKRPLIAFGSVALVATLVVAYQIHHEKHEHHVRSDNHSTAVGSVTGDLRNDID